MLLLFCSVFNMICFCYTQCKTALDLLPGVKLNILEVVSALLGKVVLCWISEKSPHTAKHRNSALKAAMRK